MKSVKYDPSVDAAYFQIEDVQVIESEEIAEGIIVDYDENNRVVGVELLGVKTIKPSNLKVLKPLLSDSARAKFQEFFINSAVA